MCEFTKGQWEAGIDTSSMLSYVWTKLKNIPAKIAVMHRCPYIKDKEQLANARLIAAAPEMYELLIFAMASLRDGDIPAQRVADRIEELLVRIDGEEAEHE